MIEWLGKWLGGRGFVPQAGTRTAYGVLCGLLGIVLNLLLFALKLLAGLFSGSIAITADAFNNLSDAGSSLITFLGFRLAARKPNRQHPFGFGRAEYLSGLAVSALILLVGAELFKNSLGRVLHPGVVFFSPLSAVILGVSILVKLYMFAYNRRYGKKTDSAALSAAAADSLSDACSTLAVLLSMLACRFLGLQTDGWAGLLVSLFILWTGIRSARDTIDPLLGKPPEKELTDRIQSIVCSHGIILGIHDLIVHDYGPGRRFVSLHAEVPAQGNLLAMHDEIDSIEQALSESCACEAIIHMDPLATDDTRLGAMREQMLEKIRTRWGEMVNIHDFRMVERPTHTDLIFDAVVPQPFVESDEEVCRHIAQMAQQLPGNCRAVVKIDRPLD